MTRIIREYVLPCYEEHGLLWVQGVHGKVGENPEVVRCRECRYYTDDEMEYFHYCGEWCEQVEPDGYCAWGERRGPCRK